MARRVQIIGVCLALAGALVIAGCGSSGGGGPTTRVLSTEEAKQLLLELPYHYVFRKVSLPAGASGAIAGRAIGAHHTILHFGVALGKETDGVPVPKAGVSGAYGYPKGGFVLTDDLLIRGKNGHWHSAKQFHTQAQWYEAGNMEVEMEEKLCEAATGEPCKEW